MTFTTALEVLFPPFPLSPSNKYKSAPLARSAAPPPAIIAVLYLSRADGGFSGSEEWIESCTTVSSSSFDSPWSAVISILP